MGSTKDNVVLLQHELDIATKALTKLAQEFEQYKKESIKWSVEDFTETDFGYDITVEQAQEALEEMINKHDASLGINWETVDYYKSVYGTEKIK
jgi:Fe-S cluster assembly iron-binding protein IscA